VETLVVVVVVLAVLGQIVLADFQEIVGLDIHRQVDSIV
jgi:hypothetical protein